MSKKKKRNGLNDIKRAGFVGFLIFIWKGHIVNWFWRDRDTRRNIREEVHMNLLTKDLKKYIPYIKNLTPVSFSESENFKEEDKAFVLWLQGIEKAPDIIKKCIYSIQEKSSVKVTLLDEKNLFKYIDLPDFIMRKWKEGKIIAAHFSDIVRIELLWKYGGFWVDASCFMTGDYPTLIKNADFFMFMANGSYVPYMFVQNCFIRARKGDKLLGMWRNLIWEYWRNTEEPKYYFIVQRLFHNLVTYNEIAKNLFDQMPKICMDSTHQLWYNIGNEPFEINRYNQMCDEAFFQKCSYKPQRNRHGVNEIIPGSFADYLINGKIKAE